LGQKSKTRRQKSIKGRGQAGRVSAVPLASDF
jgi:hypothetical protein